jgi:hypothetical protein
MDMGGPCENIIKQLLFGTSITGRLNSATEAVERINTFRQWL